MATHDLFFGGQRTNNPHWAMFPQVEPNPDDYMEPDARGTPIWFSLTRRLIWSPCCASCGCSAGGCGCEAPQNAVACACPPSMRKIDSGSAGLHHYLENNPIAVGDVINSVIIPKGSALVYLWYKVEKAITPFTFDIRVRGNAASLGGTTAAPVPFSLITGVDGTTVNEGLICVDTLNSGCPLWFDQNDMIQVVVTDLPPQTNNDCGACCPGGIAGSSIIISPVVMVPCRGFN